MSRNKLIRLIVMQLFLMFWLASITTVLLSFGVKLTGAITKYHGKPEAIVLVLENSLLLYFAVSRAIKKD